MQFVWPEMNNTVSIVALALALAVFVFGAFSGARANKVRIVFAVCLATGIGWCAMPLAVKAASALHIAGTKIRDHDPRHGNDVFRRCRCDEHL